MFIHIPILIIIANGIDVIIENIEKDGLKHIITLAFISTYAVFSLFFFYRYFNGDRVTGMEINSIKNLSEFNTRDYSKVYFVTDQSGFLLMLRFAKPVSPYEFQETKDEPFSQTKLDTDDNYSIFTRFKDGMVMESNSLIMIQDTLLDDNDSILKGTDKVGVISINDNDFYIYEYKGEMR